MIWPGRAAARPAPTAPPPDADTWAARSQAGPVPAGWLGLRVSADGQCTATAEPGQAVPTPRFKADGGTAWWVRSQPWPLCFAPWPSLAPEAGLGLTLSLDCPPGPERFTLLALQLADATADVTDQLWAQRLRQREAIKTLPPCATPALLANAADALSQVEWPDWQVRVSDLHRLDLALPHAPAAPAAAAQPEARPDGPTGATPAATSPGPLPGATTTATAQVGPMDAATAPEHTSPAPTLATMLAQDKAACRQLARELPRLGLDVQQRWAGGGWSSDADVAQRQRHLSQAIGLMASSLGALPSLAPRPGARRQVSAVARSMVWLHALQAAEALGRAHTAVQALPPPRTPPTAAQLLALEEAVSALQAHLQVRQLPWWE